MLCDELVNDPVLPGVYGAGWAIVMAKIKKAQKFRLTPEFAASANGLVDNLPQLEKVAPWCRTPYPLTWFEFKHTDRPHWDPAGRYGARPIDRSRHQLEPLACGFLLEQVERASRWSTHLFWRAKDPEGVVPKEDSINNGSIARVTFDTERRGDDLLTAMTEIEMAEFGGEMIDALPLKVAKMLAEYATEDWGGEIRYVFAVLGLMNTRNVVQRELVSKAEHNVKRARRGHHPLFDYHLLKVRPGMVTRASGGGPTQHGVRMHFVTGHFKTRRSGVYWWNAHVRGSIEQGFVSKDYELTR